MAAEKKNVKPIDFESNTFKQMKDDMMSELNVLLREMERHGSEDGVMTVKIVVHTEEKQLDDGKPHVVPSFKHKIKTGFNVQHEKEGELAGDYVLKRNDKNLYQLELLTEQLDMMEEEVE